MHGFNALFNWLNIINLIQVYIQIMFTGMSCLPIGSTAQGRIQDLWLGGCEQARGLGPGQSPGRGPRGMKPPLSSEGLRNYRHLQGRIQDLWLGGREVPSWSRVEPETLGILGITDIYLKDNFEPTTPFLSDQKNLILSLNFVG